MSAVQTAREAGCRVYDLGGSLIIDDDPEDGETYFMAPGVYIVTIGGGRPTKITVR